MSAATLSDPSLEQAQQQFVAAVPTMRNTIAYQVRHLPRRCRAEAIADGVAAAWHAWYGLARRGKDPRAVGPTGLAYHAAQYVRGGRRLGTGTTGRGAMDVFNPKARKVRGYQIVSLDRGNGNVWGAGSEAWRDWIAEDNRVSPADEACFFVDFADWLSTLPPRKRQIAQLLAEGHETGVVAGLFGVSSGRVSQIRSELAESWGQFQAQALAV